MVSPRLLAFERRGLSLHLVLLESPRSQRGERKIFLNLIRPIGRYWPFGCVLPNWKSQGAGGIAGDGIPDSSSYTTHFELR